MSRRHAGIDWLKVICAQIIVWHHAATYAPPNLHLTQYWPQLSALLLEPGRWVVHVFLVVGGYLSMQGLQKSSGASIFMLAWQRYRRLMPLFVTALAMTLFLGWWVRGHYAPEFVSPWPNWFELWAHLALTFDWWGVPAISAGAWYVAIDFQLYVLLALAVLWFRRTGTPVLAHGLTLFLVLGVMLSTLILSRQAALDAFAPYFLGSYGLGCLVAWIQRRPLERPLLWLVWAVLALDLSVDWRDRQALALATAAFLWVWPALPRLSKSPLWLGRANDLSYALFVGHFSLLIGLGAWWSAHISSGPKAALMYFLLASGLAWLWAWSLQTLLAGSSAWLSRHLDARPRWA